MVQINREIFRRLKESVEFFHNFSDDELMNFLSLMNTEMFKDGTSIFKEYDQGDKMYILVNGMVIISKRTVKKEGQFQETELAKLEPGVCFGEIGLIDHRPRSASATAKGKTLLFSISNEIITKISRNPKHALLSLKLFQNFSAVLASRLRETDKRIVDLTSRSSG